MSAVERARLPEIDPRKQFEDALKARDIVPPAHIVADGRLHRCDAAGKGGKNDAAYLLHDDDFPAGGFENHRDGLGWETWRADLGLALSASEREAIRVKVAAAQAERDLDIANRRAEAQAEAQRILERAQPATTTNPYCELKRVSPYGAYVDPDRDEVLIVPVRDISGTLRSLQFIGADKTKLFLKGGAIAGNFHLIGNPSGEVGEVLIVAEGFATAASIHAATDYPVAVAFDCGNLRPVAEALWAKYSHARFVIAADDDHLTVGNPGLSKARAAAAAVNGVVASPSFGDGRLDGEKDFNDLAVRLGEDAVRRCINTALSGKAIGAIGTIGTGGEEWPEPDMSAARQNRRAPPALPKEVFGPMWSEWITAAAEGASCPVDYVAGPLLGAAAMLIGNSRWVSPWQGWKEPPVIWIGVVGDPAASKSPGADPVLEVVRSLETELASGFEATHREWATARESARCAKEAWAREVSVASKEGTPPPIMPANAVEPAEPMRPRIMISDATPEALGGLVAAHEKGLLFFRDELAGWFNGFGRYSGSGADRAFWVEAYGGRSFTIDRVKHPLPVIIPRLSIGVLGGVQPDRLSDLIDGPDDGLQARFLWLWPDKVPPRRPTRVASIDTARTALQKLIELPLVAADDGGSRPFLCPLADDAADTFEQWRKEHAEIEVSGVLASAFGKAPGHLLRLALILEHLWWCAKTTITLPPNRISKAAILAAAALVDDYFKPMAERVFGDAALPLGDRLAAIVARWILRERPKIINARDLRRKARLPGLREAEKVKMALGVLIEAEWLRPAFDRAGGGTGRQREDYVVNPRVYGGDHAE